MSKKKKNLNKISVSTKMNIKLYKIKNQNYKKVFMRKKNFQKTL